MLTFLNCHSFSILTHHSFTFPFFNISSRHYILPHLHILSLFLTLTSPTHPVTSAASSCLHLCTATLPHPNIAQHSHDSYFHMFTIIQATLPQCQISIFRHFHAVTSSHFDTALQPQYHTSLPPTCHTTTLPHIYNSTLPHIYNTTPREGFSLATI